MLSLSLNVEEQRRCAATLLQHTLALLHVLARLLAVLAADRERQRPQAPLRDLLAALEAVAERPFLEAVKRLFDLVQRLRLHLDERELDIVLNIGFRALGGVEDTLIRIVRSLGADVADLALDLVHDLAAPLLEDPLEFGVPIPVHLSARSLGSSNSHI